ncbi:MAG: serine/threonine protein kinase [Gemmatimonadetes bacterium]|nr:serine/threonine protein kinase [Gemmatimonadota bacterium]
MSQEGGAPITPARLLRIRELFDAALELATEERAPYLAKACAGDDTLQSEVASLLAALDRGGATWERSLGASLADVAAQHDEDAAIGRRIGAYAITRLIGYGGMGAVYEGVRADDQFQKRVALKFLRRGLEGDLAIRRFRYERQILANLNHKNIAALLDGGVTPDGQPYIVMEFVDGLPITTYAAQRRLDVAARVQLLRQVCGAVQHAHQNLVVHRDLKPGNILVTPDGTVKLLDFGIARLLREGEGPDQLPPTQGGLHAFTPDYASPEQVRGLPVATPSDLYSLGVIACELLAGQRPFDFDGKLFAEMQAMIALAPAPAPSTLVTSASAASMGEGDATRLQRRLAGDLDAIVLQALRKEPERRYGSAEQLGEDLRRYLEGLPVTARRDTLGYRTRKFLRRHRVEVAAGLLVVASLVGGIVATTRQARRAQLERGKMEQVNEFLATMLSAVDPGYSGRDVTVAQVLTQAAADIGGQALDPEIEAELRQTIGQTFYGLAMYDSASTHVERAYALRRGRYGELDQRTAQSFSTRVNLAEARSEFAVAESLARVDVDHQRRMPRGQQNAAALATALDNLARMVEQRGRLDEAMAIKLESIGIRRVEGDSASMSTLPYALNNLAVSYEYKGDHARADSLMREALAVERRIRGPESVYAGNIMRAYASLRDDMGDRAGADSLMRESLRILRAALGPAHADYLRTVSMLAQLRYSANDMEGTITYAREVAAQIGKGLHEGEPSAATTMQALGLALDSLHQFAAADSALARALELRRKFLPADHWLIPNAEAVYGYHLGRVGRNAEAERILRAAYERMAQLRGADAAPTKRVAVRLAELMEKLGRTDDARRWRAKG